MDQKLSITDCFYDGWKAFLKFKWPAMGWFLVFTLVISIPTFLLPGPGDAQPSTGQTLLVLLLTFVGGLVFLIIGPPLIAGTYKFCGNMARGEKPRFSDFFAGFKQYGSMQAIFWLMVLAFVVGLIPTFVFMFSRMASGAISATFPLDILLFEMVNIGLLMILLVRYWLIYFVMLDEPLMGVFDALKRSSYLVKGNGGTLVLLGFALAVMSWAGMILGYIPFLPFYWDSIRDFGFFGLANVPSFGGVVTGPLLLCIFATAYLKLRQMKDSSAETAEVFPTMNDGAPNTTDGGPPKD